MLLTKFVFIQVRIDKMPGCLHGPEEVDDEQRYGNEKFHNAKVSMIATNLYDLDHKTLAIQ
jgi:hypothetical protein